MAEFDAIAKWYDFDYDSRMRHDIPFWLACARDGGNPVLELGAGTGRITAQLARAGFHVTGVDLSAKMLDLAEKRFARIGPLRGSARFLEGDMAALRVRGRFGTVLVPFHAFHHLLTVDRQLAALRSIRRRLAPEGLAVISLFRPDVPELLSYDGKLVVAYERQRRRTGTRVVQRFRMAVDVDKQIGLIDYYWDEYRGKRRIGRDHAPMRWRWFHRFEFEHLLARAGLRTARVVGDYDGRPFDGRSEEMIFFAARR
jgi:ubiquinone/menaquinone biosynthesis C-methylase UbiE